MTVESSFVRQIWRPVMLSLVAAITALAGLFAIGGGSPAQASYVPPISVSLSISLLDPGDCLKHTFLIRVGSDAGRPSGTVRLVADGKVLQSQAVSAGELTMTVSSSQLPVGTPTVTASFVSTATGNWAPATASIVISNLPSVDCQPLINTGGVGPLIDTGMAPDPAPAGPPLWLGEAALCLVIAAGGFVALRASKQ